MTMADLEGCVVRRLLERDGIRLDQFTLSESSRLEWPSAVAYCVHKGGQVLDLVESLDPRVAWSVAYGAFRRELGNRPFWGVAR